MSATGSVDTYLASFMGYTKDFRHMSRKRLAEMAVYSSLWKSWPRGLFPWTVELMTPCAVIPLAHGLSDRAHFIPDPKISNAKISVFRYTVWGIHFVTALVWTGLSSILNMLPPFLGHIWASHRLRGTRVAAPEPRFIGLQVTGAFANFSPLRLFPAQLPTHSFFGKVDCAEYLGGTKLIRPAPVFTSQSIAGLGLWRKDRGARGNDSLTPHDCIANKENWEWNRTPTNHTSKYLIDGLTSGTSRESEPRNTEAGSNL